MPPGYDLKTMRPTWLMLVQSSAALMSSSGETHTRRARPVFVFSDGGWHDGIEPFKLSTTDGALTGDNQCVTPLVGAFATSTSFPLHYHAANYKPCCEVPRFSGEATATLWDYDMWGSNDEVGAVTIDLNTLGEQSFTVRDGSGEAAPTWSERISGPGVAGTFNFRLLVTTDPNPATSVGVCAARRSTWSAAAVRPRAYGRWRRRRRSARRWARRRSSACARRRRGARRARGGRPRAPPACCRRRGVADDVRAAYKPPW